MSLQYSYYRPTTPPGTAHNRHASDSSVYSNDSSSPWSVTTAGTSPGGSPPRKIHHGPALLPKIRPQDVVIEPVPTGGPQGQRRVLSNTRNPPGFVPCPPSCQPAERGVVVVDSAANVPACTSCNGSGSAMLSPVSITSSHKRKASSSPEGRCSRPVPSFDLEETTVDRYGYPTYRQHPRYIVPSLPPQGFLAAPVAPNIVVHPPYAQHQPPQHVLVSKTSPPCYYPRASSVQGSHAGMAHHRGGVDASSTTLLSYLTAPNQAIKLVRNVNVVPTRGMHDYFWWDIRNLRSWSSFSLPTFNSINGLTKLLKTEIPSYLTPSTLVHPSRLAPECEPTLVNTIHDIYAPRVNAALAVSQGPDHLRLYQAPTARTSINKNYGAPHFLANYASDTEQTSSGLPRGRLVGIVKSFDRWNTGMRNEAPPRRVEYLNGLAHLQRCMREHSCRYGFIMTEIELVCVRAGCDVGDDVPYFGFLEISTPIPTQSASSDDLGSIRLPNSPAPSSRSSSSPSSSSRRSSHSPLPNGLPSMATDDFNLNGPMTASLALYFLLMLSKSVPLPSQPSAHLNVGGPGALTRQRILPERKDKWIPEPQIGERRDAKRVRGWVFPHDPWHRREGGGVSRSKCSRANATPSTAAAAAAAAASVNINANMNMNGRGVMAQKWYR